MIFNSIYSILRQIFILSSLTIGHFLLASDLRSIRSGDVLLMPVDCGIDCTMIREETNSIYTHSGVVLKDNSGSYVVAQSSPFVSTMSLQNFLSFAGPGLEPRLLRPKEFDQLYKNSKSRFASFEKEFYLYYTTELKGLLFDDDYLWDNRDVDGKEKLYCSEFITKFLNHFLVTKIDPEPMHFTHNLDYWREYFHGNIPEGKLGNSPADFIRDSKFLDLEN